MNDNLINDRDEEILRVLYATRFDNNAAKLCFEECKEYQNSNYPIEINDEVLDLL